MQAGRRVVLEKPGVSILECPVVRQRDTKQGAECEANKGAVANHQDAPARVRGRDVPVADQFVRPSGQSFAAT